MWMIYFKTLINNSFHYISINILYVLSHNIFNIQKPTLLLIIVRIYTIINRKYNNTFLNSIVTDKYSSFANPKHT